MFPKIVVPQNGCFIVEDPIKMDDLGVPLFSETSICFRGNWSALFLFLPKLEGSRSIRFGNLYGCFQK